MVIKRSALAEHIYFFGLCILVTGLPLSVFLMSLSQFLLGFAWVMQGDYRKRISAFFKHVPGMLLCGIFLMHLLGLTYSSDLNYGMQDLRIKIPVFVIPFIIFSIPALEEKKRKWILNLFVSAVLTGTIISMMVLVGLIKKPIKDIRDISIFISHIRFSLLICLCIFYLIKETLKVHGILIRVGLFTLIAWFIVFLLILQSVTGLVILLAVIAFLLGYSAYLYKNLRWVFFFLMLLIPLLVFLGLKKELKNYYVVHPEMRMHPDKLTRDGHLYNHNPENPDNENGYPIWMNVCQDELKEAWNKRSGFPYDGKDLRDQEIRFTLIRFLTSKGLKKDRLAVESLSEKEVHSIEKGITNVKYQGIFNFRSRIHMIIWEYDHYLKGGNPSGHSVTQRIEFWKAALGIIKTHPLTGVGTGDVRNAFLEEYSKINSSLDQRWRLFSHNQYLTFGVAFGIPGLLYFIFCLVLIFFYKRNYSDYLFFCFWFILMISMFTEDTLETQAGVTFFSFFISFLLPVRGSSASHISERFHEQ